MALISGVDLLPALACQRQQLGCCDLALADELGESRGVGGQVLIKPHRAMLTVPGGPRQGPDVTVPVRPN